MGMLLLPAKMGRFKFAKFFATDFSEGNFLNPAKQAKLGIHYRKIKAFRFKIDQEVNNNEYLDIDGEKYIGKFVQNEIIKEKIILTG